jgi:hypothetical protein
MTPPGPTARLAELPAEVLSTLLHRNVRRCREKIIYRREATDRRVHRVEGAIFAAVYSSCVHIRITLTGGANNQD